MKYAAIVTALWLLQACNGTHLVCPNGYLPNQTGTPTTCFHANEANLFLDFKSVMYQNSGTQTYNLASEGKVTSTVPFPMDLQARFDIGTFGLLTTDYVTSPCFGLIEVSCNGESTSWQQGTGLATQGCNQVDITGFHNGGLINGIGTLDYQLKCFCHL